MTKILQDLIFRLSVGRDSCFKSNASDAFCRYKLDKYLQIFVALELFYGEFVDTS